MKLFERWCAFTGNIPLPSSPSAIAAFIADHSGLDAAALYAEIVSLDERHEVLGYAPPGRSTLAIAAFNQLHHVEAPRSWTPDQKQFFACLPWGVQMAIARREADRDRALNKIQNEAALKRKKDNGIHKTEAA